MYKDTYESRYGITGNREPSQQTRTKAPKKTTKEEDP